MPSDVVNAATARPPYAAFGKWVPFAFALVIAERARMKTLGIDLAAQPKGTFGCSILWSERGATLERLERGQTDARLVTWISEADLDVIGIDVPFGWPRAFRELLAGGVSGASYETPEVSARLRLRRTDLWCAEVVKVRPLSVSSDRIGCPAMRWRLLRNAHSRLPTHHLHEVYPAAALACWGIHPSSWA